mgnify:CR=1 FL=1
MIAALMRTLGLLIVAFIVMQAVALFLFVFFSVSFARGFTAGAAVGIVAAALCGFLWVRLDAEQEPHRPGSNSPP